MKWRLQFCMLMRVLELHFEAQSGHLLCDPQVGLVVLWKPKCEKHFVPSTHTHTTKYLETCQKTRPVRNTPLQITIKISTMPSTYISNFARQIFQMPTSKAVTLWTMYITHDIGYLLCDVNICSNLFQNLKLIFIPNDWTRNAVIGL